MSNIEDGNLDIVKLSTGGFSPRIEIFSGDGNGNFVLSSSLLRGDVFDNKSLFDFDIADANNDGDLDLLVPHGVTQHDFSLSLGNGDGTFGAKTDFVVGGGPRSVAVGHFN